MMRRTLIVAFAAASFQSKGSLNNPQSRVLGRINRTKWSTNLSLDFNDTLGGGGTAHGQLINRARIASPSTNRVCGAGQVGTSVSGPAQNGMTSLAHQVAVMERALLYKHIGSKVASSTAHFKDLVVSHIHRHNKTDRGQYDDFLPKLLEQRKPNVSLSEDDSFKLRHHQRLLRSEFHSRAQLLLETSFSVGVPRELAAASSSSSGAVRRRDGGVDETLIHHRKNRAAAENGKRSSSSYLDDSSSTYTAGANLGPLASFFNLFRLTRLAFTLEGEVLFTPEGTMEWQSLEETRAIAIDIEKRGLFGDRSRHKLISSSERFSTNKLYASIAEMRQQEAKQQQQLESGEKKAGAISESCPSTPVASTDANAALSTPSSPSSVSADTVVETAATGTDSLANATSSSAALAAADSDIVRKDLASAVVKGQRPTSTQPALTPTGRGTLGVHSPQLQRSELTTRDMQDIMALALNAVELELRGIDGVLKRLFAEEEEHLRQKEGREEGGDEYVPSPALQRRARRLMAEADEAMAIICDSIFMCGRGTEAVDALLDAVESAVDPTFVPEALPSASNKSSALKTRHPRRPLLMKRLIEARQQMYSPQE